MVGERNAWVSGGIGTGDGSGTGDGGGVGVGRGVGAADGVTGALVGDGTSSAGVGAGDAVAILLPGGAAGLDPLEHPATMTSTMPARAMPVPTLRLTARPPRRR
jgi:hypothetical protein